MRLKWIAGLTLGAGLMAGIAVSLADEGMWTFDNPPTAKMKAAYGFAPDKAWLDRVQAGSARLQSGCSSAIVSATGLVQTNHHCVVGCVQNLSAAGNDLVRSGFMAKTQAEERQCPGLAVEVQTATDDVTARITAATRGKTGADFTKARDGAVAEIEKTCKGDAADKRCQVVSLYQGGQYKLYSYGRFNDVRLVFAPELDAAFFGGDPDNFNFPRYAFDVAFLRLYKDGQPAATPGHLKLRATPLADGEMVFVSGNPGTTSRQLTTDQLAFQRDHFLPWRLQTLSELRGRLLQFSAQSAENRRMAADVLFGVENSYKAMVGRRQALVDPNTFRVKLREERTLKAAGADVQAAYGEIGSAVAAQRRFFLAHQYVEARLGQGSSLLAYARTLVRGAEEREKPDGERLPDFTSARLPATAQFLLAAEPVEAPLEELLISFWASKMREYLTADDPLVIKALGKESPEAFARRLVASSQLADPVERKRLWEGGKAAIEASTDPAIVFFRAIDADARALRARFSAEVDGPITRAQERIAKARFARYGASIYPDATFTLRLSYGKVAGWTEPTGRAVPAFTLTSGLWARATGADPFALTPRWAAAKDKLNPNTIFNIASTNDIIGGNSGSPLLDKDGRVVGAVFDGNIHSLGGEYVYDGGLNRTVTVSSVITLEALDKVYGMNALVAELTQ
jgi:hypothetical protein